MTEPAKNPEQPSREVSMRASDADRERVAKILHNAMGEGRITMAELEDRLDTLYAAKTFAELEPLTEDLPTAAQDKDLPPRPAQSPSTDLIGGTPGSTTSIAVMSGVTRKGSWVVPRQHNSVAFWGGVEIDLRQARFAEAHTTITAVAIMGGIEITVPEDVAVHVDGVGIMGGFEQPRDRGELPDPPPGAPVVRITGLAFWGGVEVVRKPGKRPAIEG